MQAVMFAQCTGFWAYGSVEDIEKEYAGLAETTDPAYYIQVELSLDEVLMFRVFISS